jgi:tryptophan 2,3-dioxygenase
MAAPVLPNYGDYLRLRELLSCQSPPDFAAGHTSGHYRPLAHHDEMLFVVVHQVFELWFKEVLHDLGLARDLLGKPELPTERRQVPETDIPRITALLGRVNEILRLCHDQFTVLETMPSVNFLAFRDQLLPASGFQSAQFRELEILAGIRDADRITAFGIDYMQMFAGEDRARVAARKAEMSFKDAVFDWLSRTPVGEVFPDFTSAYMAAYRRYGEEQAGLHARNPNLTEEIRRQTVARVEAQREELRRYLEDYPEHEARAHAAFLFIASYREEPLLRWPCTLLESVIEFEERLRMYRYRHARMVERMIGFRIGTGGSSGVAYLDETAFKYRVFGPLLEGRSFLLSPALLPPVPRADLLSFRGLRG